jgi:hypothetical protein
MSTQQRIPFHFHAEGHAFSGEFRHPGRHLIDAQASASLPTIGGHAVAHSDNFHFEDFVSFKSAHTHVSGRRIDDETFKTHATSIIEDLNILDVVTAERIVSRLTSTHNPKHPEGHIIADGTEFHNLRIAGHDVRVILRHKLLVECKGFQDLRNHVEKGNESGRIVGRNEGVVICSLVDRIETALPGVDPRRHVFKVPNFGTITLAEIFAEPGTRTLTMMRLQLGSPHVADLTAAETRTNGQPPPPPLS